jgi:hypothetical protein
MADTLATLVEKRRPQSLEEYDQCLREFFIEIAQRIRFIE